MGEAYAQAMQTTYFDYESMAYPNLHDLFAFMNLLRNRLMGVHDAFGSDPTADGFWNATRVHHYPCGGAFMTVHRDTYFPVKLGDIPFYQVMVPLSVKGRDFHAGGGVLVSRDGATIDTDQVGGMGSVIIFDGRILHGVEDIDPQEVMSFSATTGRVAAFNNVYVAHPAG